MMFQRPNIHQVVLDMKRRGIRFSRFFATKEEAERELERITRKRSGTGSLFFTLQESDGTWSVRQRLTDMSELDRLRTLF